MNTGNSGIKQWPLAGALVQTHGKQIIGPATVMYDCVADGQGGWVQRSALPAFHHEVRAHGDRLRVYSIDRETGKDTGWA
mgnify:CR=1 FL=1